MRPAGSSPLTRGKRPDHRRRHGGRRLIPAHAGKTLGQAPKSGIRGAHPRSRGENYAYRVVGVMLAGSSPLTRGKRLGEAVAVGRVGLIPAHAGKTFLGLIGEF